MEGPCAATFEVDCNDRGADRCNACGGEGERCCNNGAACTGDLKCLNQVLETFNGENVGICEACGGDGEPARSDNHGVHACCVSPVLWEGLAHRGHPERCCFCASTRSCFQELPF